MYRKYYTIPKQVKDSFLPNRWDFYALIILITIISLLGTAAEQMRVPYELGQQLPISLDPTLLPEYGLRSVLRIVLALIASFIFSLSIGMLAARNASAEKIIIPLLDVLQSVPVLGFLSVTVVGFIALFPNSLLGPECAAIFAIFTAQAWNMAFSVYQSFSTVPTDLMEAARAFRLTSAQRFWRIELPFAMPGLLWNTMMSVSASWFFVVASEAITVSNQHILLPGIGSYIAVAIAQTNIHAVIYASLAMLVIILIYDQLIFRPLLKWSDKFRMGQMEDETQIYSWFYTLLKRTKLLRQLKQKIIYVCDGLITPKINLQHRSINQHSKMFNALSAYLPKGINIIFIAAMFFAFYNMVQFILSYLYWDEITHVFMLGFITTIRIVILIIISSLLWVPIGVWIGLHPTVSRWAQPLAQFLAAFPANLLFPFVVILIVKFSLNVEIWTTPLMILGTQWYILFNVIAGTSTLPNELQDSAKIFGVKKWLWWKRLILPAIFPYYVTGALAATGGCWNASIVAEVVSWGSITLTATGLGAYIAEYTTTGDFPRIVLGITVMSIYVVIFNRCIWHQLYLFAQTRCRLDI